VLTRFRELGDDTWPCWALSNHDVERSATSWGEARALLALTVLCSLRGNLCIYQGEELGLPEAVLAFEDLQDPFGINLWPEVKGRDGCRTPMVWTDGPNGGFCPASVTPWLPVYARHLPLAVARQEAAPDSLLAQIRQLLQLRGESELLRQGEQTLIDPATLPADVFAVLRHDGDKHLLCLAHLGNDGALQAEIELDALVPGAEGWSSLSLPGMASSRLEGLKLHLDPGQAAWLRIA
jgi:alpha-glucosidase